MRVGIRQVVHQYVMIANTARVILHDAVRTPATSTTRMLDRALLDDLARDRLAVVSPSSTRPPGRLHFPNDGDWPRRTSSTLSSWRMTAPDADPGIVRVLAAHRGPVSQASVAYLSRASRSTLAASSALSPSGRSVEPVLALERGRERAATSSNFGAMTERGLQRRQAWRADRRSSGRSRRRGRVDAEQDRAVLEKRAAVTALRAPDELAPVKLDLAAAGAREAERGRRLVASGDAHHLDGGAERRAARRRAPARSTGSCTADRARRRRCPRPRRRRCTSARAPDHRGRSRSRRWPSHEPDAEAPARGDVDVAVERLAVAERHRRRRPGEEADRRRRSRPRAVRARAPRRSPCWWRRRWARSREAARSGRFGCRSRPLASHETAAAAAPHRGITAVTARGGRHAGAPPARCRRPRASSA